MDEVAARRIAAQIIDGAPAGWTRAVLASMASQHSISVSGDYTVPGAPKRHGRLPSPFAELSTLAAALQEHRGWQCATIEVTCEPSGRYQLVATEAAITSLRAHGSNGFQAVLDPDFQPTQPGAEQHEGTATAAGDPDLAVTRFREYMRRRAAILGQPEQLPAAASVEALDDAERRIGRRLPDDLRALYLTADGDGIDYQHLHLIEGYGWMSLEDLVAMHAAHRDPAWHGWELGWDWLVFDAEPPETVRRFGGAHPAWVPFATGTDGNYLAVDLSPARNGRPGQVIYMGRDYRDGAAYVADSLTDLLGHYLTLLEQGDYQVDGEYISLPETGPRPVPRQIVGEIPDPIPPTLQALHINDAASPVDLAPLGAAPVLRRLHLNRCATASLTALHALPIESLRISLEGGDLSSLRDHQHLRSLDLGTSAPTDIEFLTTIPRLHSLDLSRTQVSDLTVLAELPALRYLALTAQQWTLLLDTGKLPAALAAARLAEPDAPLDEALTWAARLGLNIADAWHTTGTLETAAE